MYKQRLTNLSRAELQKFAKVPKGLPAINAPAELVNAVVDQPAGANVVPHAPKVVVKLEQNEDPANLLNDDDASKGQSRVGEEYSGRRPMIYQEKAAHVHQWG
jgi:hypothetical protein